MAWPSLALALVGAAACHWLEFGLAWTLSVLGLFLVLATTITRFTTLDPANRAITVVHRLFGYWQTFRDVRPLEDAVAICFWKFKDADSGDRVRVGVRLRDGRRLWLRIFDVDEGRIGNEAGAYARQLQRQAGIPIEE